MNGGKGLRLCIGKEWHRFPSHFLVPDQVNVGFLQSEFKGILPKLWTQVEKGEGKGLFGLATDVVPSGMNEKNLEEKDRYVSFSFHRDWMITDDLVGQVEHMRLHHRSRLPPPRSSLVASRTSLRRRLEELGEDLLSSLPRQRVVESADEDAVAAE